MNENAMDEETMYERPDDHFVVDDDAKADWALRKIAEADAELLRMEDWYKQQLEVAQQRHDDRIAFFTGLLAAYFGRVPTKETKTMQKYSLPSGELVLTKEKTDFKATDPEQLLGWCQENDPTLVAVELKPAWAEIKKRLQATDAGIVDTETGQVVDGVALVTKPETFQAKPKKEA